MTDSLVVDPARLQAAGVTVRDQVLPTSPLPISATGSDSVSAAINATLPIIESPVVDGLPDAQTALTNTGSKIVTAADMYAETDQLLSEHVGTVQFLSASDQQPTGTATERPISAGVAQPLAAETADKTNDEGAGQNATAPPSPAATANLNQLAAMTQATQPVTQGLQTVMSGVQQATGSMGSAGAQPAKLADDTESDDTKTPDEPPIGDGAASGTQGSGSVPVQPATDGRRETTQSA
jgi:hypothetical protein